MNTDGKKATADGRKFRGSIRQGPHGGMLLSPPRERREGNDY